MNGPMHTWLVFEPEMHFSFDTPSFQCAITCNCNGVIESDEVSRTREVKEKKKFLITRVQYERMWEKMEFLTTQQLTL